MVYVVLFVLFVVSAISSVISLRASSKLVGVESFLEARSVLVLAGTGVVSGAGAGAGG